MTPRRLLVVGAFLVLGGAALVAIDRVDRVDRALRPGRAASVSLRRFGEVAVRIRDGAGRVRRRCLLAARTESQQARGLMRVTDRSLEGHDGMVFLFHRPQQTGFWMRNTPMALSIAYFDGAGRVVSATDMTPCADSSGCPAYLPHGTYTSALEVPRGRLREVGVGPGSRLEVVGP
ncbi:MAG: DUF192 domain-containing protein, partial [Actinomycetota bacterium]|nr:DUF192 domain-containing protein [Actinomycetota bacterium]